MPHKSLFTLLIIGVIAALIIAVAVPWRHCESDSESKELAEGHATVQSAFPPEPTFVRGSSNVLDDVHLSVRCNQDQTNRLQCEISCGTNPFRPETLLVGAQDFRDVLRKVGFYTSFDGGQTWRDALITMGPPELHPTLAGDPVAIVDEENRLFAFYLAIGDSGNRLFLQRSDDGGMTWNPATVVSPSGEGADKNWAVCDCNPASPYYGNIYVTWFSGNSSIRFCRSGDHRETFSTPVSLGWLIGWWSVIAVGPDGQVYVAWLDVNQNIIAFTRSVDGGVTWQTPWTAVTIHSSTESEWPCGIFRCQDALAMACDQTNGPNRGKLYLCWSDARRGNMDIMFSRSLDQGSNWSVPMRLNDDSTSRAQWWPAMAAHPATGQIGVSWLDAREQGCDYRPYATASSDGGMTWRPNWPLTDVLSHPAADADFLGDYTGIACLPNGDFLSAWPDARNDIADVYSARWNAQRRLALVSPTGGEAYSIGSPLAVSWSHSFLRGAAEILLNRDYPSGVWETVTAIPDVNAGSYEWTATLPYSGHARMAIRSLTDSTAADTTASDFSIVPPSPRIIVSRSGNDIRVGWQSTGAPYYHVYSASSWDGPLTTLEGITNGTAFIDVGAAEEPMKFYIVRASTEP